MYKTQLKLESFVHCTSTASIRLLDEMHVPDDLRDYLQWEPAKERSYNGWRFLAPDQIVRNNEENFYHIAMHRLAGAVETLTWRPETNQYEVKTYMDTGEIHEQEVIDRTLDRIIDKLKR